MNITNDILEGANILIVDDTPANLRVISEMLKQQGCKARTVPSGKLALQAIENYPPDLILLDINMPDMDGYEVCRILKKNSNYNEIPIIFISALSDTIDKVKGFSIGGVDYITKPFQFEEVQARVETHLKLRHFQIELERYNQNLQELVHQQVKEISDSQMTTIFAMAKLAQSRDDDTGKHLDRVRVFCKLLSEKLAQYPKFKKSINETFIKNIYYASPLHDIGKVGISDNILLKPGKLTVEEFEIMKSHTTIGAKTLEEVRRIYPKNNFISMGIDIAKFHHEKWNGQGYPNGLTGENIPLSSRIMSVSDVYDALKSKRIYKPPFSHEESCNIILRGSGTDFDPDIVKAFQEINLEFKRNWEELQD